MTAQPRDVPLRMYTQAAEGTPLDWAWVDEQLAAAGTYWVVSRPAGEPGHPHPRPVWGVWLDGALLLSIGSPVVQRELAEDPRVTVHLDSGVDVVVLEGRAGTPVTNPAEIETFLAAYNAKYDWKYTVDDYGPPTRIEPEQVLAWRSAGWAGREGFQQSGKWTFG